MDTLQTPKTPLKTQKIRILGDAGILGGPGGLGSLTPILGYGGCMLGEVSCHKLLPKSDIPATSLEAEWE